MKIVIVMTFIVDINPHSTCVHDPPAIKAHQIHIIQQLFSHVITLLQVPRCLVPPTMLPSHLLIHREARQELADRRFPLKSYHQISILA